MLEDPVAALPRGAVVAVAMSGGVDSSVAAARVVRGGVTAFAITLALWPGGRETLRDRGCCSVDAVEDARRVATMLGLRHYVWNAEAEFETLVMRAFDDEHAAGRTPNPCTRCNERVKFGLLMDRAAAAGATHLATGHYARTGRRASARTLHRARDRHRDQSYVLHRLDQRRLSAAVFPLGSAESKAGVRAEAAALGLATAAKAESQDLCFLDGGLRDHLQARLGARLRPGAVVDEEGEVLGTHPGAGLFTVGQRAGLGLRPARPDQPPLYVLQVRAAQGEVVVGERARLRRTSAEVTDCRWPGGGPPPAGARLDAQLRAHGGCHAAVVAHARGSELTVRFPDGVDQVSPGQALVLYAGDEVVGGGVVASAA